VEVTGEQVVDTTHTEDTIMQTKSIVAIFTASALAVGLSIGGVTTAFATDHNHSAAKGHHAITPAVPVTPSNNITPAGHHTITPVTPINSVITPDDVLNLVKAKYDSTLYPSARYEAVPGTYAGDIESAGGQSEQYIAADGNVITIGVAKGNFAQYEQAIAKTSTALTGFGANAHVYAVNGGGTYTGDYEVFAGGYWFSLTSNLFTGPQTAAPIIQAALQTIAQG
jgi:hypothetical protein